MRTNIIAIAGADLDLLSDFATIYLLNGERAVLMDFIIQFFIDWSPTSDDPTFVVHRRVEASHLMHAWEERGFLKRDWRHRFTLSEQARRLVGEIKTSDMPVDTAYSRWLEKAPQPTWGDVVNEYLHYYT